MTTKITTAKYWMTHAQLDKAVQKLADDGSRVVSVQCLGDLTLSHAVYGWLVTIAVELPEPSARRSRFDRDDAYALEGDQLQKLETIARRLDDPKTLTFDDRRDLANLMNVILSDTTRMERHDDER